MHTMSLNPPDQTWYMDTRATSHMTFSNARLVGDGKLSRHPMSRAHRAAGGRESGNSGEWPCTRTYTKLGGGSLLHPWFSGYVMEDSCWRMDQEGETSRLSRRGRLASEVRRRMGLRNVLELRPCNKWYQSLVGLFHSVLHSYGGRWW
ncbi:hypothetical protein HAX54_009452 [Datura stramonium]|uniref:Uncharacterized protein n=1 Tax=Datura stramonium TaxID=4076 RepID=A0ABS8TFL5_DATST|nr:hypothetical protein [Datura stramonium]